MLDYNNISMNNISKIRDKIIDIEETILCALKKMDGHRTKLLFVFDKEKFICIVTIGDIQRAIIRQSKLSDAVSTILDTNKIYASEKDSIDHIKEVMFRELIDCMPVLNKNGEIVDVLFWNDVFKDSISDNRPKINLPVVIMAGGKGTRLKPITNVIPKPLVPIGDKTILEVIMDQFENIGCSNFYMSVNYKSDMIRYYLDQLPHKYQIEFFEEPKPLGTIGSVSLLKGKIKTPFFVSNCDSINEQDYRDVYDYHIHNKNDMTIVTMVKTFTIPYGVIETGENGLMVNLMEKPEHTYMVNTGVYILNPELIEEIPDGEFFHITHLMDKVKSKGGRIGCFPVSEHAWKDMGEWPEYLKMIKVL